jgi:manganese oxidase
MIRNLIKLKAVAALAGLVILGFAGVSQATVDGITGPTFNLTAKSGYITTPEGGRLFTWGYANGSGSMQYPGPTMIVNEGATVVVHLTNQLLVPVSIVFPGQDNVVASGGTVGTMTHDALASGGTVTYTFVASHPGTFAYQSGTDTVLQTEMGLFGALVVRSATAGQAYDHADSAYDREYLFLESQMDPVVHELVETNRTSLVDWSSYTPEYWFLNGRNAPDTMDDSFVPWLPNQPYSCMPRMHPGEKLLLRIVNEGGLHPFHTHGNHMLMIGQDGKLLQSAGATGIDLAHLNFTYTLPTGGTADCLFTWTGEKLGWDIYGHAPTDPLQPGEYAPDHGKPFPVVLPDPKDVVYGAFYSGSPFLGTFGYYPPPGTLDLTAGYFYMWHSHKEEEIVNNNVFPGGMMTMLIVEAPWVPIP